jgi:hypothetical protein
MEAELSDRAVDCFVHGVAHLLDELGPEAGLSKGIGVLCALASRDLTPLLDADYSARGSTIPAVDSEDAPERPIPAPAFDGSS